MNDLAGLREALFLAVPVEQRTLGVETIRVLAHYQFERSAAAYTLIRNQMVWDAEIIIRSVYETSSKIMLLGAHDEKVREELISEFWEILPGIFDRKVATKAEQAENLRLRRDDNEDDVRIFRRIRDPKFFDLEARGNKRYRDEVERRWSFSEIIKKLTRASEHHVKVPGLEGFNHMYGIASHLAHASPKAIDLMDDRASRGDDLHDLEAGHICRMLSDLVLLGAFSLRFAQRLIDNSDSLATQLDAVVRRMIDATRSLQEAFARSQDEFYEKHS